MELNEYPAVKFFERLAFASVPVIPKCFFAYALRAGFSTSGKV